MFKIQCHDVVERGPDEYYYIMKSEWDSASCYIKEMPYSSMVSATEHDFYEWAKEHDLYFYFEADKMGIL